ncbi:MAG: Rrf2 family transcriptional regulator [Patescibacteria group bacterium]
MMKRKFDYGVILIEHLKTAPGEFIDVRTVAKKHKLPAAFLEKVAQELKRAGWIESRRGFGGGYRLMRDPEQATIAELINFFERTYRLCPMSEVIKIKI